MADGDDIRWRKVGKSRGEPLPAAPRRTAKPRAPAVRSAPALSVAARVRIARGTPQAVIKVLSYRSGRDAVHRTAAYVIGKADERFVVEGDVALTGTQARHALLDDWAKDFSTRTNGRDVMHMEMSAPPGSDRGAVFAAARAFAAATFGATHQYALAEHRDTKHPHCHILVKLRGHDGRMLDPRKRELGLWRAAFAAAAREQGLALDASPRVARGIRSKGVSRAVVALHRRGVTTGTDSVGRDGTTQASPYRAARARREREERDEFRLAALRLERSAKAAASADKQLRLRAMAREVLTFGERLPVEADVASPAAATARLPARAPPQAGPDIER